MTLHLSTLAKTWIFDVDGTLVRHNGYLTPEGDILLSNVQEELKKIPAGDVIILLTARREEEKDSLIEFLNQNKIRFDHLICGIPTGERILINDNKPSGLVTAYAITKTRDSRLELDFVIDNTL